MTPRLNVSMDDDTKKHLEQLKLIYEKKLLGGGKLSLAWVVRTAIYNTLMSELSK